MLSTQDTTWAPMARVVNDAIASRTFPGAVVVIGRHDTVLYEHAFGNLTYEREEPVTLHTVWDLASLTKVVGLTFAMMQLVEENFVALDSPAVRYVPAFSHPEVTVRQLLTHSSGLPAFKLWFNEVQPGGGALVDGEAIDAQRARMFALANAEPLEAPPGTRMVYSDIGAMVLTEILENVMHAHSPNQSERIDAYLARHLFEPLGMTSTRYRPPASWLPRIAPTEIDNTYRHRLVRGEVHDENAWSMGGISGHAGLFSDGPDLAKYAQLLLKTLRGESSSRRARFPLANGDTAEVHQRGGYVDSATVAMFTRAQQPGFSSRALGWDTPSEGSSAGTMLSAHAFGHTGFTGTSIWIDPDKDLFIILLTNRVYPTRDNPRILAARRAVADTAVSITGR